MVNHSTVLNLAFKQTKAEEMVRAASTILFNAISKSGYPSIPLSKLAQTPQYGFTAAACYEEVGPKLVRITDIQDGIINWETVPYCQCDNPEKYLLAPNDILFARTGATTGKTYLVQQVPYAIFASYLIRLNPNASVHAEYLYSFFQSNSYWSQILDEREGSAQPNVNGRKLLNIEVPLVDSEMQILISKFLEAVRLRQDGANIPFPELPAFLSYSRRLVGRIEELATRIEEARELRQWQIEETEALMKSAMRRFIGDEPSEEWIPLSAFIEKIENGWSPSCENRPANDNEWGVLKVGCVSFGFFNQNENKALPLTLEPRPDCEVRSGDFLMSRANTLELVGACAIVKSTRPKLMLSDKIFRFHFKNDSPIDHKFLDYVFKSSVLRKQIQKESTGTSPTMKNISKEKVLNLLVPAKDIREQMLIVATLDRLQSKLDALNRLQAETATELDALMPAVLERAFRGEL